MATTDDLIARNAHLLGASATALSPDQVIAWTGFMAAHQQLFRSYAHRLEAEHELSPSALGLLGRLVGEPEGRARLTELAEASGLSLSRVSRLVDHLEQRGLAERRACPNDGRACHAHITGQGRALATSAQRTTYDWLQEEFFGHLDEEETAALARALGHFVSRDP